MEKLIITENGFNKLKEEYNLYSKEKRKSCIEAVKEARENSSGEISENTEYLEALAEKDRVENKMVELEEKLSNCRIIRQDEILDDGVIRFGVSVKLLRLKDEMEFTYQLVGIDESNVKEGRISYLSPLAKELLNQKEEEIVECSDIEYEILNVFVKKD